MPTHPCTCRTCVRGERIERIKAVGERADLSALVDELLNDLMEAEEDLNYKNCILDGSWPQAVEILTRALAKAKARV